VFRSIDSGSVKGFPKDVDKAKAQVRLYCKDVDKVIPLYTLSAYCFHEIHIGVFIQVI